MRLWAVNVIHEPMVYMSCDVACLSAEQELLQKDKEYSENQQSECYEMVPLQSLTLEKDSYQYREHCQGDNLLNDFELHQIERTAVAVKANPVRGHLSAVFKKGDAPREQNDQNERPSVGYLHLLKFKVTIPRKSHKHIGSYEKENCV